MEVAELTESNLSMFCMSDLSSYSLPPEIITGKLASSGSDYMTIKKLSNGSNSTVYETKMLNPDGSSDIVAQKVLSGIYPTRELPIEVYRELTILNDLNHDNVVKLREIIISESPSSLGLIFDKSHTNLHDFIKYYPLPEIKLDQIKCITVHLLRGLNYLHKNYIVHRDIKPSNLLVDFNGPLKISDFGTARRWSHLDPPSTPGRMTYGYQAPEILFLAPEYDSKVDMWSAGCVLIELITRKPFFEDCPSEIAMINRLTQILGSPRSEVWPKFKKCKTYKQIRLGGQPYNKLVDTLNVLKCTVAVPLLEGLIVYDPEKRFSAETCLRKEWFEQAPYPSKHIECPEIPIYMKPVEANRAIRK